MPEQQPSVGRVVHYVSHGTPIRADGSQAYTAQCRAAIITAVGAVAPEDEHPNTPVIPPCDLAVFNPEGMFFNRNVPMAFDNAGGTWHWPERV
jgi:hypothetical protein